MEMTIIYPKSVEGCLLHLDRAIRVGASQTARDIVMAPELVVGLEEVHHALLALSQRRALTLKAFHEAVAARRARDVRVGHMIRQSWNQAQTLVRLGDISEHLLERFGFHSHGFFRRHAAAERLHQAENLLAMDEALRGEGYGIAFPSREHLMAEVASLQQTSQLVDEVDLELGTIRRQLKSQLAVARHQIRLLRLNLAFHLSERPVSVVRSIMRRFGFRFQQEEQVCAAECVQEHPAGAADSEAGGSEAAATAADSEAGGSEATATAADSEAGGSEAAATAAAATAEATMAEAATAHPSGGHVEAIRVAEPMESQLAVVSEQPGEPAPVRVVPISCCPEGDGLGVVHAWQGRTRRDAEVTHPGRLRRLHVSGNPGGCVLRHHRRCFETTEHAVPETIACG